MSRLAKITAFSVFSGFVAAVLAHSLIHEYAALPVGLAVCLITFLLELVASAEDAWWVKDPSHKENDHER